MTNACGPFTLEEPLPDIPHSRLLIALQPWIDVGSVGTMALSFLEESWRATDLGRLTRPGNFYDFSRYRPMLFRREGERHVAVANTVLRHALSPDGVHWLFLHALEPHNNGEDYVDGLLALIKRFHVRQYFMIGSMYGPVPHTRPPIISGGATSDALRDELRRVGVRESNYEGPTTILATLPPLALAEGIDTATVILQLPAYAQVERDYRGLHTLLDLTSHLFGLSLSLEELRDQGDQQTHTMDEAARQNPQVATMLSELESMYDTATETPAADSGVPLSPELEGFLKDIQQRLEDT